MANVMSFPTRIVHGRGAIRELPQELRRVGARTVLVVTDKGILQAGLLGPATALLDEAGIRFSVFSSFDPNPTDADALRGIEAYRSAAADAIVAIGGGASLDMGKAIRLLVHHDPPLGRYDDARGGDKFITEKQPPFIAVPTTAGTGSEVGRSTVLVIDGTKVVIFSPYLLANAAILDPELTVGLPPFITAATGMDALTHNLEAYVAKGDHPLADAIALDGLRRIGKHLARAVKNGKDIEARLPERARRRALRRARLDAGCGDPSRARQLARAPHRDRVQPLGGGREARHGSRGARGRSAHERPGARTCLRRDRRRPARRVRASAQARTGRGEARDVAADRGESARRRLPPIQSAHLHEGRLRSNLGRRVLTWRSDLAF